MHAQRTNDSKEGQSPPREMQPVRQSPRPSLQPLKVNKPAPPPNLAEAYQSPTAQFGELASPTSPDTINPNNKLVNLMDRLNLFEEAHGNIAAYYYLFGVSVIFMVITILLSWMSTPKAIPDANGNVDPNAVNNARAFQPIQILFLAFLYSFLLNYYIIRETGTLPYIEHEEDAFDSKVAGAATLISIISLYYAQTFISERAVYSIFFAAPLISLGIERYYSNVTYTEKEQAAFVVAYIGVLLVTKPPLFWGTSTEGGSTFFGLVFSIISAGAFTLIGILLRKLHQYPHFTLNHIVSMFAILFLPLFFPMQGVSPLAFWDWIIMTVIGGLAFAACIMFIRAFQIERSVRVFSMLYILLVFLVLKSMFWGGLFTGFTSLLGAIIILGAIYVIMLNTNESIKINDGMYANRGTNPKELEMELLPKHSIG